LKKFIIGISNISKRLEIILKIFIWKLTKIDGYLVIIPTIPCGQMEENVEGSFLQKAEWLEIKARNN
jgi:hypothetical protein